MSAIFHQAVLDGDATKVRFLLKYSPAIRIDHPNKHGLTALQQAAWDGNFDLVNFLLEQGADLSLVDSNGYTALHFASQEGHLEVVSLLVNSACVNVNAKTVRGEAAVDVAENEPVRALLSQAMLTDSFKKKCRVDRTDSYDWGYANSYKNTPGCRYSLSSASTDSGVYDDSNSSYDSYGDPKSSRTRQRLARENSYESYASRSTTSDYSTCSSESRDSRRPLYRKNDGSTVTSILKSQSFSGKLYSYDGDRGSDRRVPRCASARLENARSEMERYRRQEKVNTRDPSRRRTVTFGETDKEADSTTVLYNGSYTDADVSRRGREAPETRRARKLPPVPPPRVSTLLPRTDQEKISPPKTTAQKSTALRDPKTTSPNNTAARDSPRDPANRKNMFAGFLTKSMH